MTGTSNRRFTASDLENLTKYCAPWPWKWEAKDEDLGIYRIVQADGRAVLEDVTRLHPTLDLMASAPELAADYHRVRTELEQLREGYLGMAREEARDGHHLSAQWNADVAFALARILEGDNHE